MCAPDDPTAKFGFCDQKLSIDARAADLVSRLTLEEKQSILDNGAAAGNNGAVADAQGNGSAFATIPRG